jgi:hypothetical protein
MVANNGFCGVGIAFNAKIGGLEIIFLLKQKIIIIKSLKK